MEMEPKPIALGEMIGSGRSGEVYALDSDQVVKLFHLDRDQEHVEREFHNTQAARQAGLPVPEAFAIIRHGERMGIVFQRIAGEQLEQFMVKRPWTIEEMARRFARLHLALHQRTIAALNWQITRYLAKIRESRALPFFLQRKAMQLLCALPLGEAVCHGDFTPPNVIIAGDETVVVDWPNATLGNPVACVVETALNLVRARENCPAEFMRGAALFREAYLGECALLRPDFAKDFARWEPVVAAAMLNGVTYDPERERLLAIANSGLRACGTASAGQHTS